MSSNNTNSLTHGNKQIMATVVNEFRAKLKSGGRIPKDRRRRSAPAAREAPKNDETHEKERYIRSLIAIVQKEAKNFHIRPRRARKIPIEDDDSVPEPDALPKKHRLSARSLSLTYRLMIRIEQTTLDLQQSKTEDPDSAISVFSVSSVPAIKFTEYEEPVVTAVEKNFEEDPDPYDLNTVIRSPID